MSRDSITLYRDGAQLVVAAEDVEQFIAEGWCEVPLVPLADASGTDPAPCRERGGCCTAPPQIELNGK